jgi:hypothetical protein
MPNTASRQGLFLVFAIPVEGIIKKNDGAAMRMNAISVGIEPDLTGFDRVLSQIVDLLMNMKLTAISTALFRSF